MKNTIKIITIVIALFLVSSSYAQELRDGNGDLLATIESSGIIKDSGNDNIGQFMANGDLQDSNGDVIGKIDGNNIKDVNDHIVGSINGSDELIDVNNMKIAEITTTQITEENGQILLVADSTFNQAKLAAYYFFFYNL